MIMAAKEKRLLLAGGTLLAGMFISLLVIAPLSIGQVAAQEPDPTPTPEMGIQLPPLPNLIVSSMSVIPDPPIIDNPATVRVGVKNVGDVAPPPAGRFYVDLYIDPQTPPMQLSHDGVASGTVENWRVPAHSAEVFLYFTMTNFFTQSKVYNAYAQVDTDDNVTETNEFDNVNTWIYGDPYPIQVGGTYSMTIENHQQWQDGIASNLDLSNPKGVVRLGMFRIPYTESVGFTDSVYHPDYRINDLTATVDANGVITMNHSIQAYPVVVSNGRPPNSTLYAAWVDSRHADPFGTPPVYNHQIYTARSCDGGLTWQDHTRVVNWGTPSLKGQSDPDMYVYTDGATDYLFLVWADDHSASGDIYFSRWSGPPDCSGALNWSAPVDIINGNPNEVNAMQRNPSVTAMDQNQIAVVWEDYRNGNADVYSDYTDNGGLTPADWYGNRSVTDNAIQSGQVAKDSPQVNPAAYLDPQLFPYRFPDGHWEWRPVLYVVWEDWRTPNHPEIYATWAPIGVYDFSIDTPVNLDNPGSGYRIQPSVVSSTSVQHVEGTCLNGAPGARDCTSSLIHVAWEEVGDSSTLGDIYYAYSVIRRDNNEADPCNVLCPPPDSCEWPYEFCFRAAQKINGWTIESDYALPPPVSARAVWPIEPTEQKQVRLTKSFEGDFYYCGIGQNVVTYTGGVYLAWADPRSYDNPWRQEVYFARIAHTYDDASPPGDVTRQELLCPDELNKPFNYVVNDNAKLYKYRDDLRQYAKLDIPPASTRQQNPILLTFFEDGLLRLGIAWDDNRWEDPLASSWPANYPNQDVYFTRWGEVPCYDNNSKFYANCGVFISKIYTPTGAISATWRSVHWHDVTFLDDDITLQTRIGHTNTVNNFDNADTWDSGGWQSWSGSPSSNYLGCLSGPGDNGGDGPGCEYDMSGRQVVDRDGYFRPSSEYLQFKINIRGSDTTYPIRGLLAAVSRVVIRYSLGVVASSAPSSVYLPIILKSSS
jgi:hypothetical protein